MSILIKGMKMPECCDKCFFAAWSKLHQTAWCDLKRGPTFSDYSVEYRTKRANFCPLVGVQPHGDLIDRDLVLKDGCDMETLFDAIKDMPAVISAEESNMDSFIRIFEEDDEEDGMDSFIRVLKD